MLEKISTYFSVICLTIIFGTTPLAQAEVTTVTSPSGLKYQDNQLGTGAEAVSGKNVVVNYTGWLDKDGQKGTQFDSSVGKRPFQFQLGAGMVIKGWDEGVSGMKIGGKRTLMIPAALAYGDRGAGALIPPNSNLIFDVELLEVK